MLRTIAFFAAATALPLAAASAQDTTTTQQPTEAEVPSTGDVTTPTDDAVTPPVDTQTAPATEAPATDDPALNDPAPSQTAPADPGVIVAATAADFSTGAVVRDPQGGEVGTIESSTATGAILSTGTSRVQLPVASFGKNSQGLVIALTKAELDAQAAAAPQQPQ